MHSVYTLVKKVSRTFLMLKDFSNYVVLNNFPTLVHHLRYIRLVIQSSVWCFDILNRQKWFSFMLWWYELLDPLEWTVHTFLIHWNSIISLVSKLVESLSYLQLFFSISCLQLQELLECMPGPDFPTGGTIVGNQGYVIIFLGFI